MQKTCLFCGKTFNTSDRKDVIKRQKFCSPLCRSRWYWKNHPDKIKVYIQNSTSARKLARAAKRTMICRGCSSPIPIERNRKSYCSDECYVNTKNSRERSKRQQRRLVVFNMLGGAICKYCGCNDPDALEINHINLGGNKERRKIYGKGLAGSYIVDGIFYGSQPRDDVEVVCRVCNAWHYITKKIGYDKWKITWSQAFEDAV